MADYVWRIRCTTENKYYFVVTDAEDNIPTVCPSDAGHTVDGNLTSYRGSTSPEVIKAEIIEEDVGSETGGHPQRCGFEISVGATVGEYSTGDITFPIPIALSRGVFTTTSDMAGDKIKFYIAPDTVLGALQQSVSSGKIIDVPQTVIDNTAIGYWIELVEGGTKQDLGRVISIDEDNMQLTIENTITESFTLSALIQQTIKLVPEEYLENNSTSAIEISPNKARHIPANTIIKGIYENTTGGSARKFRFSIEYKY